ncbi:MAG: Spi family protease inhibitor [Akkermansia sp.]|nr:Spi family protease inhibitor [Akkermansia sp.]
MRDFHLAEEAAAFIADNLDIPFTTDEMNRYIRTHHTEHPDFAQTIPSSFARLVAYDRAQAAESSPLSRRSLGEGGAAAYYIAVFQHFGYALISADGTRSLSEIAAYSDYINALRSYQGSATENAPSAES